MAWLGAVMAILAVLSAILVHPDQSPADVSEQLWQHRNLGKAFYENQTTYLQAIEQFREALKLAPDSPRERLNYGLALIRAGQTDQGIAEFGKSPERSPPPSLTPGSIWESSIRNWPNTIAPKSSSNGW